MSANGAQRQGDRGREWIGRRLLPGLALWHRLVIAACLALAAALAGCSQPPGVGSGSTPVVVGAAPGSQPSATTQRPGPSTGGGASTPAAPKIYVVVKEAGFISPFENGAPVLTSGPFSLQVSFSPYPPVERADLLVRVLDDRTGEPVDGAQVVARADMPGHGHGMAAIRLEDRGSGVHGTPITLFMGGDWTVDLDVRKGSGKGTLTLLMSTPTV